MFRPLRIGVVLLIAVIPLSVTARGAPEDDRPAEKIPGLKFRVFEIKHRAPDELLRVLRPLASGVKGTSIADSVEFRTITIRDFPENIAAIEDGLKRLDTPAAPKPDVELKMRVLIAAPSGSGQVPADLDGVVKQLHATLSYKGYYQIASITQRVKAGSGSSGKGVAQVSPPVSNEPSTTQYQYSFENVAIGPSGGGAALVQVKNLKFQTGNKQLGEADIATGLTLREGEKVVVGSASLKDRALILVLSARVIR